MTEAGELTQVGDMSETREQRNPGEPEERGRSLVPDRWRLLPGWAVVVAGAVAFWVVGYLPWIVEGMHVEVSSAWPRFDTLDGPRVALPFGQYAFATLLVSGVIGGTAALAVSRFAAPTVTRARALAGAGALIAVVVSLAQTLLTVRPALVPTDEARFLLGALVVAVLGSGVFGVLVGAGVARGNGWSWLLGGATAASFAGSWLVDLIVRGPDVDPQWVLRVAQWHPWVSGILVGVVLAVFGIHPTSRLVGWVVALAIAWTVPSVLTAVTYVSHSASQGSFGRSQILEVVDAGRDVFVQSLLPSNHPIWTVALVLVVAGAGVSWRALRASDRPA